MGGTAATKKHGGLGKLGDRLTGVAKQALTGVRASGTCEHAWVDTTAPLRQRCSGCGATCERDGEIVAYSLDGIGW